MLILALLSLITVEGRVVNAVTQQPVGEARVVLLRDGQSYTSETWNLPVTESPGADSPVISVRTNELGVFRFQLNAPAKFRLFVSKDGYVRDNGGRFDVNEDRKDLAVRLMPEAVISGRVIDVETQKPLRGFAVAAQRQINSAAGRVLFRAGVPGRTDEEGRYRITQLPPGEYYLEFAPPLGGKFQAPKPVEDFAADVRMEHGPVWYPGGRSAEEAAAVAVMPGGQVDGIDFKVAKRPMPAVRGVVGAEADAGEVSLMLIAVRRDADSASFAVVASGAVKGGEGFEVANLTPGDYFLSAHGPGPIEERQAAHRAIRVEERNVDLGEVVLQRGLDVKGSVVVEGADPPPSLKGMLVSLSPPLRMSVGEKPAEVDAATGGFVLRNNQPETFEVRVARPPKGFAEREARYNGTALVHGLLQLDPVSVRQELEVVLAPANGALEVTVTDGSRGLEKATVVYFQDPLTPATRNRLRRQLTGVEGRVTIPGLLPGKYRVAAFPAGAAWANDPLLDQRLSSAQEVNVPANATATIQIRAVMQ